MAFTHIVMFKWNRDDVDDAGIADALRTLVARFDGVQSYLCGRDAGLSPDAYDFAIVATFDDRESFIAYRDHPDHQRIVTELIRPNLASRTAAQLED